MARLFDGTDDNLQTSASIPLGSTSIVSVSFWLWWDAFGSADDLAFELGTGAGAQNITVNPDRAAGGFSWLIQNDTSKITNKNISDPSAAAWHHYVGIFDISAVDPAVDTVRVWVDGTEDVGTYTAQEASSTAFSDKPVNFMSRNAASLFGAGRMSEVGVWTVALTEADIDSLASGVAPNVAQPTGLVAHWPLNCTSPEEETIGSKTAVVTGATCTDNPPLVAGAAAQGPRQRQASGRMWRRWA